MTVSGIYEKLITQVFESRLEKLQSEFYIQRQPLDTSEAALYLSRFLGVVLQSALDALPNEADRIARQIEISNALIRWLAEYVRDAELSENLIASQGQILTALFAKNNPVAADLKNHVAKITPLTGLSQSELFTGSNVGLSLESEIKREIRSCDEICWLVSFCFFIHVQVITKSLTDIFYETFGFDALFLFSPLQLFYKIEHKIFMPGGGSKNFIKSGIASGG